MTYYANKLGVFTGQNVDKLVVILIYQKHTLKSKRNSVTPGRYDRALSDLTYCEVKLEPNHVKILDFKLLKGRREIMHDDPSVNRSSS